MKIYSEQEVLCMMDTLKQKAAEEIDLMVSGENAYNSYEVQDKIKAIDIKPLLMIPDKYPEKNPKEVSPDRFIQGYVCAVACLINSHDLITEANEVLKAGIGDMTSKKLRSLGVDEFDIEPLIKHGLIK